jgi:hypothetical protein
VSDPTRLEAASYRAAPGTTISDLHKAVKARMTLIAADAWWLATKTTERAPVIFDGWAPPKTADAEQFPFITIRPAEGEDSVQGADQESTATVAIAIGVYRDEDDGWLDLVRVIDAIRLDLAEAPAIAGTAFEHKGPLAWQLHDESKRPQWLGHVTTTWTIPRPRRVEALNPQIEECP